MPPFPSPSPQVVTAWNGMAISAFARAGRVLPALPHCFPVEGRPRGEYLEAAAKVLLPVTQLLCRAFPKQRPLA